MRDLFRPTTYRRPKDVEEAVSLLATHGKGARILAGGTDLMVQRPPAIEILVDIGTLGLSYIMDEGNQGVRIGTATPVEFLERAHAFSAPPFRALAEAAGSLATPTIRNMATIGGNLCNASPAADLSVALMAMGGVMVAVGSEGRREIPVEEFFLAPNVTALREGELLTEIRIPPFPERTATGFTKLRHHQTSVDIAVVNVATRLQMRNGRCTDAAIAFGAAGPTPLRARRAEALLIGESPSEELLIRVSRAAMEESKPIDDIRASADYRRKMVAVLAKKNLETSLRRCEA